MSGPWMGMATMGSVGMTSGGLGLFDDWMARCGLGFRVVVQRVLRVASDRWSDASKPPLGERT